MLKPGLNCNDLSAAEIAHDLRNRSIEPNHVHHTRVIGIGDGERIREHTDHDELGRDSHVLPILH